MRIRQLSQLRAGMVVSVLVGLLAAVWALGGVSLVPPRIKARSTDIASATTQIVIDAPKSAILDVRQDGYAIRGLTARTVLVGNVIASPSVREYIARRVSIPVQSLQIAAPLTPAQPRAILELGGKRGPRDLLKSNGQYRLAIRANPTVPALTLYAQAPSPKAASKIASSAVEGLRRYLEDVATARGIPAPARIHVLQLGHTSPSGVINKGVRWQLAALAFFGAFALSGACFVYGKRVALGYRVPARPGHHSAG